MLHTHHQRRSRLQLASITVLLNAFSSTLVLTNSFSIFPSPPKPTPSPTTNNKHSNNKKCTIKICHNKDCTKQGGGEALFDTFRDLLPASSPPSSSSSSTSTSEDNSSGSTIVSIESSGCLSQCGKGPNIMVVDDNNGEINEKMYFGVEDVTTASAVLDVVTGEEYPINLLVASASIADAEHATSPSKKETLLTSAISALTKDDDPTLVNSFAHAHALYLRADARLDLLASSSSSSSSSSPTSTTPPTANTATPNNNNNNILYGAVNDAKLSTQIHPTEGRAWRTLARVQEANGSIKEAMDAVEEWARLNPSFRTKAKREMERLVGLL